MLSDLIETDRQHAVAVEAALGAALQALVVPSVGELPAMPGMERLAGRVTFLGLDGFGAAPGAGVPDDAPLSFIGSTGPVVPLRSLVRCRGWAEATMSSQLGPLLDR
ncbi:MAG TPA: hypothetical protein PK858_06075, partial [Saprospiraceae bacterium]|nr:hypothetical protein [Saprospiraceae bacterium]